MDILSVRVSKMAADLGKFGRDFCPRHGNTRYNRELHTTQAVYFIFNEVFQSICLCLEGFLKGTQAWEFFGLWFWNLYFFVVSYA